MDKELQIAILISAMVTAGTKYDPQFMYSLFESQNVAEIAKRVYEALLSKGYCLRGIPENIEVESELTRSEGE